MPTLYSAKVGNLADQLQSDNSILKATCYPPSTDLQVTMCGAMHPGSVDFHQRLCRAADAVSGIEALHPYQIVSACNIAYRPGCVQVRQAGSVAVEALNCYAAAGSSCDLGQIAVNDLLTGSGKTLVTMLACIEVAQKRRADIEARGALLQREQLLDTSYFHAVNALTVPPYHHMIVIFCPRHLTGQWARAAETALRMSSSGGSSTMDAFVHVNPLQQHVQQYRGSSSRLLIAIYDNAQKVSAFGGALVPVVVVDEYIQRGDFNFVSKACSARTFVFGRLVLVSADAGHIAVALRGLRGDCILKRWTNPGTKTTSYRGGFFTVNPMDLHIMGTASVVSTVERSRIKQLMGLDVPIHLHSVRYVPTLGGVIFGSAFEISQSCGTKAFLALGVDVAECRTTAGIVKAIITRLSLPVLTMQGRVPPNQPLLIEQDRAVRQQLLLCLQRLSRFRSSTMINSGDPPAPAAVAAEQCPICLDDIGEACILQPCWHVTCTQCMQQLLEHRSRSNCPLCRGAIRGLVTGSTEMDVDDDDDDVGNENNNDAGGSAATQFRDTLGESITHMLGHAPSVLQAVVAVLVCLEHHNRLAAAEETTAAEPLPYRVLVAVPAGVDFDTLQTAFSKLVPACSSWFKHFEIIGNAQRRVTATSIARQLQQFTMPEGSKFRVLFTAEGVKDSMTGLDFSNVDALVSVGTGNNLQRIGRLTRLGRQFARGCVSHFELEPL